MNALEHSSNCFHAITVSCYMGKKCQALPRLELGSLDSKSIEPCHCNILHDPCVAYNKTNAESVNLNRTKRQHSKLRFFKKRALAQLPV